MVDEVANNPIAPDTQRSDWTREEKAALHRIADKRLRKDQLRAMFPGRSLGAIKLQLYKVRRELELPKRGSTKHLKAAPHAPRMLHKDEKGIPDRWLVGWSRAAEASNQQYLEALRRAA